MTVRSFRHDDAVKLAQIYEAAVETLASRHYSREQIAAWLSIAPEPCGIAAIYEDGRSALCGEVDGLPVAFSDHDAAGRIQFLYCDPNWAGRGVADQMICAIEKSSLGQRIDCLSSEVSKTALGFSDATVSK